MGLKSGNAVRTETRGMNGERMDSRKGCRQKAEHGSSAGLWWATGRQQ